MIITPNPSQTIKISIQALALIALVLTVLVCPGLAKEARFIDNHDKTITDTKTGLMLTQQDSWNLLKKCLNWNEAQEFVKNLKTGGHQDWRLPTLDEIGKFPEGFLERGKANKIGAEYKDWRNEHTLHLDAIFEDGAAYWVWSSDTDGDSRAGIVDMRTGHTLNLEKSRCFVLGVRAVRKP